MGCPRFFGAWGIFIWKKVQELKEGAGPLGSAREKFLKKIKKETRKNKKTKNLIKTKIQSI